MGRYVGEMTQASTGLSQPVYEGFSWPVFFFGPFWYMVKGMWGYGLLYMAICFTGVGWVLGLFIAPFLGNRQYLEHLGSRGYTRMTGGNT